MPDWWFSERFEIESDHTTYPTGLSVYADINNSGSGERARIYIGNNTGSRIYLVSRSFLPDVDLEQPTFRLPFGYTAFELLRGGQGLNLGIDDLQNIIRGFIDQNVEAPDRPPEISVPPPQSGDIFVLVEEGLITIPVTLHYTLNPNYNPENGKGGCGYLIFRIIGRILVSLFITITYANYGWNRFGIY